MDGVHIGGVLVVVFEESSLACPSTPHTETTYNM
jgi:hypothetical protein